MDFNFRPLNYVIFLIVLQRGGTLFFHDDFLTNLNAIIAYEP